MRGRARVVRATAGADSSVDAQRKEHHDGRRPEHDCADVVAGVLAGEADDFLREAMTLVARELMEAEIIFGIAGPGPIGSLPRSRVVARPPSRRQLLEISMLFLSRVRPSELPYASIGPSAAGRHLHDVSRAGGTLGQGRELDSCC